MLINRLMLLSGTDIPFIEAGVAIHQPTLKEISYIGEETFLLGCELLRFSKNRLPQEGKVALEKVSDFDIVMSIMNDTENPTTAKQKLNALLVLSLLFPTFEVEIKQDHIAVSCSEEDKHFVIDKKNFGSFKSILNAIFCFENDQEVSYKPSGAMANEIAKKLEQRRKKLAELNKTDSEEISIYSRYASILAVGEQLPVDAVMNYTIYQLSDQFNRYQLKLNYDIYIKAKLAGAQNMKEPEDWLQDLYVKKEKK